MYRSSNPFTAAELGVESIEYSLIPEMAEEQHNVAHGVEWRYVDSLRVWERQINALAERSGSAGDAKMESSARRIQLFAMQQLGEIARDLNAEEWLEICRRDRPLPSSSGAGRPATVETKCAA